MDRYFELSKETPYWDDVYDNYHPEKEHIQIQNYSVEMKLRKLKPSL